MADDRLDALIDEVARASTDAAPSGELRARVLRQIAAPAPRAVGWRPRVVMVTAVAAAAVVVVAVLWPSDERVPTSRPRSMAVEPATPPPVAATSPAPEPAPVAIQAPRARTAASRGANRQIIVPETSNGEAQMAPVALDPLRQADIELEAVAAPERIDIDAVSVSPLAIATLAGDDVQ